MYTEVIVMLTVWATVIAIAILVEYFTCQIVSIAFVPAGVVAIMLAAFNVGIYWQIPVFLVLGSGSVFAMRPLFKRYLQKINNESFTVKNRNIGQRFRLVDDVIDGRSSIIISDVTWAAVISPDIKEEAQEALTKGALVEVLNFDSNKAIVKPV